MMAAAYDVIGEIEAALLERTGAKNVETTKRTLSALIEITEKAR